MLQVIPYPSPADDGAEMRNVVSDLDALLARIDQLGHPIAANHISLGLEMLREAADYDTLPTIPLP